MTASCPRTARRMSSRLRPSPWTTDLSPRTPANVSGRRVNAVIECPRRTPSSRTSLPVRPVEPIPAMFRFGLCWSDSAALTRLIVVPMSSRGFGPALGTAFDLGSFRTRSAFGIARALCFDRPCLQEILAHDIAVEMLRDDLVVLAPELGQSSGVVLQRLQQANHGSAALFQLMTIMLGAQRGRELGSPVERHVAHRGAKPLQHDRRVAPLARRRGLRVGGRWHVP